MSKPQNETNDGWAKSKQYEKGRGAPLLSSRFTGHLGWVTVNTRKRERQGTGKSRQWERGKVPLVSIYGFVDRLGWELMVKPPKSEGQERGKVDSAREKRCPSPSH